MRPLLRKTAIAEFEEQLRQRLPAFKPRLDKDLPRVCRLYGYDAGPGVTFFVQFQAHRSEDSFTVEIAWSRSGRWPIAFLVIPPDPAQVAGREGARFRLGRLWSDRDVWWEVSAISTVSTQVNDAVTRLIQDGLSYFWGVARGLGVRLERCDAQ